MIAKFLVGAVIAAGLMVVAPSVATAEPCQPGVTDWCPSGTPIPPPPPPADR